MSSEADRPRYTVLVPATSTDALRRRLEDRAELLEATRLRYRALRVMLRGFLWKERLRRNAELLRQTAQAQAELDQVLDGTARRAEAEGWPEDEPLTQCVHELLDLRDELTHLAARRLRREAAPEPLAELLRVLEAGLAGPRKILPGQKWTTALEILPSSLVELRRAAELGERLERVFNRPMEPGAALPFDPDEVELLRTALPEMEAALQALWRRVHQCDPTGGLLRFLQRRARRAPLRPPKSGPEELLRAAFWYDLARARLKQLVDDRLSPVQISDAELFDVLAWLVRRERDPAARLSASQGVPDARAGLMELSNELWHGRQMDTGGRRRRGVQTSAPRWPSGYWDRLIERARRADGAPRPADHERLLDSLRLFVRIRERMDRDAPPGIRPDGTLEALVLRARELAAVRE